MKKLLLSCLAAMMAATATFAQNSGLGFNYQAVVRKADGMLLANQDVSLRISLYPGQSAASPTWVETHKAHTDASGCFGITVGHGLRSYQSVASQYADVNFAAVYYWMKIEIEEGSAYREVSFAQLPSTPYSEVSHNSFSAGMILPFAGPASNIPAGWLLCDGRALNRSKYGNLYDAIGVSWGTGDGSTTFNIPDLRGMFLRGVVGENPDLDENGKPILDPDVYSRTFVHPGGNTGNNVGSYQGDAIRNITGTFTGLENAGQSPKTGAFYNTNTKSNGAGSINWDDYVCGFDASRVVPTGADNRPKNVYVNYIIKY